MNSRFIYLSPIAEGYTAAVNILAVQYLVKTPDVLKYSKYIDIVYSLTDDELSELDYLLSLDMHVDNVGAMIVNGDFDEQLKILLEYLDN